jgi:hypothetical protein
VVAAVMVSVAAVAMGSENGGAEQVGYAMETVVGDVRATQNDDGVEVETTGLAGVFDRGCAVAKREEWGATRTIEPKVVVPAVRRAACAIRRERADVCSLFEAAAGVFPGAQTVVAGGRRRERKKKSSMPGRWRS